MISFSLRSNERGFQTETDFTYDNSPKTHRQVFVGPEFEVFLFARIFCIFESSRILVSNM